MPFVLGVDGGNTKTLAAVAAADGSIVSVARGGCTDIYGAPGAPAALDELVRVVREVCDAAGVPPEELHRAAFCVAGADWPEDNNLYRAELAARLGLNRPIVLNDGFGTLYAGTDDGVGVSVACGTYLGIGARSPNGRNWHSFSWAEPSGAHGLGSLAIRATYRADLGLEPATTLSQAIPRTYGVDNAEALLHLFTRREGRAPEVDVVRAARVLLDEADCGDEVARRLVSENGTLVGNYVVAAARRVGLGPIFPVVFAGGIFSHDSRLLEEAIVASVLVVFPDAQPIRVPLPPVAGAVIVALADRAEQTPSGIRSRIAATLPADMLPAREPRRATIDQTAARDPAFVARAALDETVDLQ